MAIESACIPLPSEIIMPLSGWMLIKEQGLSPIYTLWAGFYGALGCLLGSIITYWVGAWGGRPVLERYGKYVLIPRQDLDRAERWFNRHGSKVVFFSRLLPVIRTFISLPAGIAKMSFFKFMIYTFLGSFPWCLGLAYGGYLLGEHWERIREVMRPFDIPILVIIIVLFGFYIYHRLKQVRSERPG
ncbi:MAG TPA: DedA family protein [Dehalococcoidia bacterium]|nr:DedA family protein [Dehalococcoidia bacterium]